MSKDDAIWPRLIALVETLPTQGIPRVLGSQVLTRETDLVLDLGLAGDDAFGFMELYAALFGVERGDFDLSNYFEAEGLWLLPSLRKKKPKMKITLGMLESAARDGEWRSANLCQLSSSSGGAVG